MYINISGVMLYIFEISVKNSIEWYITHAQKFNSEKCHFEPKWAKWLSAHFQTHAAKKNHPRFQTFLKLYSKKLNFSKNLSRTPAFAIWSLKSDLEQNFVEFCRTKTVFPTFHHKSLDQIDKCYTPLDSPWKELSNGVSHVPKSLSQKHLTGHVG